MARCKSWKKIFCGIGILLLLTGCTRKENMAETQGITFIDALGHTVQIGNVEKTAVMSESLAQAWLLAGGNLAATTEDATEILESSTNIVDLGSLKNPSVETLLAEDFDLVIMSSAIVNQVKLYDTLEQAGVAAVYFDIETFEDYKGMMEILTDITGNKELYQENVGEPESIIAEQVKRADGSNPTILLLRAYSTGVKAKGSDTMTGQMLSQLGCINIADNDQGLLENLGMEAILEADPEYIFVTTMGSSEEAALAMVDELLTSNPAWQGLSAIQKNQYYVLEQELFHNKPNNRWGESYQKLADILYGEK